MKAFINGLFTISDIEDGTNKLIEKAKASSDYFEVEECCFRKK